jgi:hypothetical protein
VTEVVEVYATDNYENRSTIHVVVVNFTLLLVRLRIFKMRVVMNFFQELDVNFAGS